jgi:hypothetical protein
MDMDLKERIEAEAARIEGLSEFSSAEAEDSLRRGLKYFQDCGQPAEPAFERAAELVELAVYKAREEGFDLRGMVDLMLLGRLHRVQAGCEF